LASVLGAAIWDFPGLIKRLSKAIAACRPVTSKISSSVIAASRQAASKVSSSFKGISFLAGAKRHAANFAKVAVEGVCVVAYYGFWIGVISYGIGAIGGAKTSGANAASTFQGSACNCPTPASSVYRPRPVSAHDCSQGFGIRPQYPAPSASYTGARSPVSDCSPPRKARKGRRVQQPCADVNPFPAIGTGNSSVSVYGIANGRPMSHSSPLSSSEQPSAYIACG
jgi:hypothetical protein